MIENKNRSKQEDLSIQVAEESREVDWKSKSFLASIFMGDFDMGMTTPFPEQDPEDKAIGDALLERIRVWAEEHLDGELIDTRGEIPAHVFKGLNDLGLFGCKIPREYGGLGLSITNYGRVLGLVSGYCASTGATLSAHQSIGVPQPLKLFGTEEQKRKYLPQFANGAISAFALTEPDVGSDPARMNTRAERSEDGSHWILNGEKLWCTNGGIADVIVVMASTPPVMRKGKEINQITAFIVETHWEGVENLHRCQFMGLRGVENVLIRFDNVRVPAENLIWEEGKGLRLALTTLNDGRLGIPAVTAAGTRRLVESCTRWAKGRVQWGRAIGAHEAGSDKLARMQAGTYAMAAISDFSSALAERKDVDLRMEAAAAKLYNSERSWEIVDLALQIRGGRGYEHSASLEARGEVPFPIERGMRDARINRIVEGTTDVMHLFLAREALDKHLKMAGPLFNPKTSTGEKIRTVLKCGLYYATWYPKLLLGGLLPRFGQYDREVAKSLRFAESRSRRLARVLFHKMLTKGPKLEMAQLTLARIVDVGVEISVMGVVAARIQTQLNAGHREDYQTALYALRDSQVRIDALFHDIKHNNDMLARKLAKEMMEGVEPLPKAKDMDYPPRVREYGKDLTSGRQTRRASEGGHPSQDVKAS